jgi:hypothetical protein
MSDVIEATPGKTTDVFQRRVARNAEGLSWHAHAGAFATPLYGWAERVEPVCASAENMCFSVICKDRTLDLQAPTSRTRDTWVEAINMAALDAKRGERFAVWRAFAVLTHAH